MIPSSFQKLHCIPVSTLLFSEKTFLHYGIHLSIIGCSGSSFPLHYCHHSIAFGSGGHLFFCVFSLPSTGQGWTLLEGKSELPVRFTFFLPCDEHLGALARSRSPSMDSDARDAFVVKMLCLWVGLYNMGIWLHTSYIRLV